jgi:hypothetical protein
MVRPAERRLLPVFREIRPRGVTSGNQIDLLAPRACLYLLLPCNGAEDVGGGLEEYELRGVVAGREAVGICLRLVLGDAQAKVGGDAGVDNSVALIRQDIDGADGASFICCSRAHEDSSGGNCAVAASGLPRASRPVGRTASPRNDSEVEHPARGPRAPEGSATRGTGIEYPHFRLKTLKLNQEASAYLYTGHCRTTRGVAGGGSSLRPLDGAAIPPQAAGPERASRGGVSLARRHANSEGSLPRDVPARSQPEELRAAGRGGGQGPKAANPRGKKENPPRSGRDKEALTQ